MMAVLLALIALLALALLKLQTADWLWVAPDTAALAAALLAVAAYAGFCLWLRRRLRAGTAPTNNAATGTGNASPWLVTFASQTGFAERLARQTAESLHTAGVAAQVLPLAGLDATRLGSAGQALFVVSTTGEGDAPDNLATFVRSTMNGSADLSGLRYGLLALGDRDYRNFCGFGRELDAWLRRQGAEPAFETVEVDNGDAQALQHWQTRLGALQAGADKQPFMPWREPGFEHWRLASRRLANPGSAGARTFYLRLEPEDAANKPRWQAGDIVEIRPHHPVERILPLLETAQLDGREPVLSEGRQTTLAEVLVRSELPPALRAASPQALVDTLKPLAPREYSIASLPEDGGVEILVRQSFTADGQLGIASGWLTEYAWSHARIEARVRSHANFHLPAGERPLILVCNGTGIGGLRAHLKERIRNGRTRNWLIFGERNAEQDYYYRDDVETWHALQQLERLDTAFSRDQSERLYVQHRLQAAADLLREWVAAGAAVYVCGSQKGMSEDVHATLQEILGVAQVQELLETGRYRRDVY